MKKALFEGLYFKMAGKERIELSTKVLETLVIPFNYFPDEEDYTLLPLICSSNF